MGTLFEACGVFVVCALLFMGWLIRQQGLTPQCIWLPYTILRPDAFYDHHMLFHVYLSLFTGDGQAQTMIAGAKLSSILMPSFRCLVLWWLLRSQGGCAKFVLRTRTSAPLEDSSKHHRQTMYNAM